MRLIGKYFETTLRYINDSAKSEWFVPDASNSMSLDDLKRYSAKLLEQNQYWLKQMDGAHLKSIKNIGKIIDNQMNKLAAYEKLIFEKEAKSGGVIDPETAEIKDPVKELPPALKKTNWLLIGGVAIAAILILRR